MIRSAILASAVALIAATTAFAQTDTTEAEGEEAETAETTEPAPPPEPEYNGSASGTASGTGFSMDVVCEGFGTGGPVTVKSDPGGAPGEDVNGDGQMIDISATPDGNISLQLMAGNNIFGMDDTSAKVDDTSLSYSIKMTFSGGITEEIVLNANCS